MTHMFNTAVAMEYGVNAAVILENISFWIKKNEANGENFRDGHWWTYNTAKAFTKLFPYFTERQIRYALNTLVENGILITANYSQQGLHSRTLWYALSNKGRALLGLAPESVPDGEAVAGSDQVTSLSNGDNICDNRVAICDENVICKDSYNNINNTIPDNKPDNTPPIPPLSGNNASIIPSSGGYPPTGDTPKGAHEESVSANKPSETKKPSERASVKRFVRPTVDEVRAYCRERNNSVDAERFVDYYESKGWLVGKTPMKDWRAAVRTWERGNTPRGNASQRDDTRRWCFDAARVDDDPLPFG